MCRVKGHSHSHCVHTECVEYSRACGVNTSLKYIKLYFFRQSHCRAARRIDLGLNGLQTEAEAITRMIVLKLDRGQYGMEYGVKYTRHFTSCFQIAYLMIMPVETSKIFKNKYAFVRRNFNTKH